MSRKPQRTWRRFFELHMILVITTVLCAAFSFAEMYFIVGWIMHSQKGGRLRQDGLVTQGTIVTHRFRIGRQRFTRSAFPTVEFHDLSGHQHQFESPFQETVKEWRIGKTVKILYMPNDPNIALIDGAGKYVFHPLNFALITAAWLFTVLCGYGGIRTYCLEMFYGIPVLQDCNEKTTPTRRTTLRG